MQDIQRMLEIMPALQPIRVVTAHKGEVTPETSRTFKVELNPPVL